LPRGERLPRNLELSIKFAEREILGRHIANQRGNDGLAIFFRA
jgi:hypothetical protein